NVAQLEALRRWNIAPNNLSNGQMLIPFGTEKVTGHEIEFQLRADQVKHEEWCALIREDVYGPQGHVLAQALEALEVRSYDLEDILAYIGDNANWANVVDSTRNAVIYKLDDYRRTVLFGTSGLSASDVLKPGLCSVLML